MASLHLISLQYKHFKACRIPDNNESILSPDNYLTAKPSQSSHQGNNLPHNTHEFGESTNFMLTTDGVAM